MPHPDLLAARPSVVLIELTSRCNLRCAYCASSQPNVRHQDLGMDGAELIEHIRALHPRDVQMNGHGETTVVRGWDRTVSALWEAGLPLSMTTNLARLLEPGEIDTLSFLERITVSCDSSDAELLARLRGGAKLENIEQNLAALVGLCARRSRQKPYVCVNAVVSDLSISGLPELARWTARNSANGLSLVNLVPYEMPKGVEDQLRHPADQDREGAVRIVEETRRVAEEVGIDLNLMPGFSERLGLSWT